MQVPCPSLQLPLPGWQRGQQVPLRSCVSRSPICLPPLSGPGGIISPLPWMQVPIPVQSQPWQLQLSEYLLARHTGSVLCIASTSVCCPDLTALQSFQAEILIFVFPLQVLLCCCVKEVGGTDGQTHNWGEREDEPILPSEYCNWTRNEEQDTILSMTQPGNTCCFPVPLPGLARPHCSSHKEAAHGCHPTTRPTRISQPGQVKPGSSWYLDRLVMPKGSQAKRGLMLCRASCAWLTRCLVSRRPPESSCQSLSGSSSLPLQTHR